MKRTILLCALMLALFAPCATAQSFPAAVPETTAAPEATTAPEATVAPEATAIPTPAATPAPTATPTPTAAPAPTAIPGPEAERNTILISAAGDCTLGGTFGAGEARFASTAAKNGLDYFFSGVKDIFTADDLTIVNLEGPLTNSSKKRGGRDFNFRGKPEYAGILSAGGVDAATIANNHFRDMGTAGVLDTRKALSSAGVTCFGLHGAALCKVRGVRVALVGLTEWDMSTRQIKRLMKRARKKSDLVIVTIHWGKEKHYAATPRQRRLARLLVRCGAKLVLGSHSHVVSGIEIIDGVHVVYSLGNFCFGGNSTPFDNRAMIFQQAFEIQEGGAVVPGEIRVIPCLTSSTEGKNDFRPIPAEGKAAEDILATIDKLSTQFDAHPAPLAGREAEAAA